MTTTQRDPVEAVFREYGNRATRRDYQDAARVILTERRACNADAAQRLAEMRRNMWNHAREAGVIGQPRAAEFLARVSRSIREKHGRGLSVCNLPRATAEGLRREIAGYESAAAWRRSEAHAARMRGLPCGLQDADATRAWEDSVMLRLCRIMLRIVEKES